MSPLILDSNRHRWRQTRWVATQGGQGGRDADPEP